MAENFIHPDSFDDVLKALKERAKELNCVYKLEGILSRPGIRTEEVLNELLPLLPTAFQYPDICAVRIEYKNEIYQSQNFTETPWLLEEPIYVQERRIGRLIVCYTKDRSQTPDGPFSEEEKKLVGTIAERLSFFILYRRLRTLFSDWKTFKNMPGEQHVKEWRIIVNLLRRTDHSLLWRISRKLINHLMWIGIDEVTDLLQLYGIVRTKENDLIGESNRPLEKKVIQKKDTTIDKTFAIAEKHLTDTEILANLQKWIQEDKSNFLVQAVENYNQSLTDIAAALTRYHHLEFEKSELSTPLRKGLRVSLIRRFLTEQLDFINVAKNYLDVEDFYILLKTMVFPSGSHGVLGGKSAGLILASNILHKDPEADEELRKVKTPRTWYLVSDTLLNFIHYNNLEEVIEQKYKEIDQVRREYNHILQLFKNSHFPPEVVKGLSMALDDLGDQPLIVRSSSLLEDSLGSAFSGKYKSLFLANQGRKEDRLNALMDAIAEVYSSTFGPDPIEYRAERGLLDFHEEMAIMIEEVVGTRVGKYFFPAFAGVAFSNNEFRWSPRIKRNDGLARLVPGLGTRAVDRLGDDYPILIAPGQPGLRVNATPLEMIRYSPQKIDVINLETNSFETIELAEIIREYGDEYPQLDRIVSKIDHNRLLKVNALQVDYQQGDYIATFESLFSDTTFLKKVKNILDLLQLKMHTPVDIEFACDGDDFYLLQCRPQSYSEESKPAHIPPEIEPERLIFNARRYISNGYVPEITHIVYVDPGAYQQINNLDELKSIGRAIGALNKVLPKRKFILMGPGRWGSRGDIKLGVNVSYSDINNTAVLIEIARKSGNYQPDLSFGTHFFQDLVEASIRYLPLYPDEDHIVFNEEFLTGSENMLPELLPEYASLAPTVHVIDVRKQTGGLILKVLMNAELPEAVGMLDKPGEFFEASRREIVYHSASSNDHWRWRIRMAEQIAASLDAKRFGVTALYLLGSTKNASARPDSDIDLLVHFSGTDEQRQELLAWLEGWSLCLDEINFSRTGVKKNGLLDIHFISDGDIKAHAGLAARINAPTDAARPLLKMDQ